ncbi:MAG: acetate--CoA ligase [Halieaceae bacterium]|jgi:acetyl-CoA synthetase|nr:acetate--CoA ligase [Halieaceae bacterium]
MSNPTSYPVPNGFPRATTLDSDGYAALYQQSIDDPEGFWAEQAQAIDWMRPFETVKNVSFDKDNLHIRWFEEGVLNASVNCIDRHLEEHGDRTAFIWEPDNPEEATRNISYRELHLEVCRLANGLKSLGVGKGDVVTIYMPLVPEAAYAMLACARIGAIHSVVFGGFSAEALAGRIDDCHSEIIITADQAVRGGKSIHLKDSADLAAQHAHTANVRHIVTVKRMGDPVTWQEGRDVWYDELVSHQPLDCAPEPMDAEDPLFILYTSGSTGKPKGVVHCTGGYLVQTALSFKHVFDYQPGDVFWCTADVGWITGHTYLVYGPLANAATAVMHEGVPNYPDVKRWPQIIEKNKVNIFYTAPTAIRSLMAFGDECVEGVDLSSLRLLGSVGEPINPEAWRWYFETFGGSRLPIVDTWWQTETGSAMIAPLPGATALKPGSATRPFFGIKPALLDAEGKEQDGAVTGNLVILDSWPSQARTVYRDHQRFIDTYFTTYPGMFFTGDECRRDEDGYYWITGRVDDVINVSGHRMGTAELESALVAHPAVAEAAVVGYPHDIKGQGLYMFVTLSADQQPSDEHKADLKSWLRKEIGPIAHPDVIQWAPGLPKTRSGKIMRRILRKIAHNECEQLGDISTLADPSVVQSLITDRVQPPTAH